MFRMDTLTMMDWQVYKLGGCVRLEAQGWFMFS